MKMKFERWKEKWRNEWEEFKVIYIILGILSLIIFIVTMTYYISTTDFTPATRDDYSPLYDQVELLKKDIRNSFSMDNATINSSMESITLSSEECDLCLTLDNKGTIISIEEIDHCVPYIFITVIIVISLASSPLVSLGLLAVFSFISEPIYGCVIKLKTKLKKK